MTLENFAIIRTDTGRAELRAAPVPKVADDYILVRTVAVALNPTDHTTLDAPGDVGTIVGCDYAGIVEDVGASVQRFKKGDRVAGFAHGGTLHHPKHVPLMSWLYISQTKLTLRLISRQRRTSRARRLRALHPRQG